MSNYLNNIFSNKVIKDSTKNLYISNLLRLNNSVEPKSLNFLKNIKKVLEQINLKSENTKRSYLIAVCSVLSGNVKYKKEYDEYYKLLKNSNDLLKNNTSKSEKQIKNWISQDEVKEIYNDLEETALKCTKKKLNESEYNSVLSYLILSLYYLQPPRRSLDYIKMVLGEGTNKDLNYLDINNSKFIFNNYKTESTYHTKEILINDELMKVIKFYLMKRKGTKKDINFLVKYDNEPLTTSTQMTRILNKIFKKSISVNMLRHIYTTDKYSKLNKEKLNDASAMGTSVSTLDNQYIKLD